MPNIETLVLGDYEVNCYLVWGEGSESCVVIDPGYDEDIILSAARKLGKRIEAILLTHGHFDHVGAVRQVFSQTDCDIYLCPADCQMPEQMTAGPLCYTHSYQEGDVLTLAGCTFRVLHTPGHTPGSVCLICDNCLFSGDTLFAGSCGRTDLRGGDYTQMLASLKRLALLEGDYHVLPGHDVSSTLARERQTNYYMKEALSQP